jgi:hypothetical protein
MTVPCSSESEAKNCLWLWGLSHGRSKLDDSMPTDDEAAQAVEELNRRLGEMSDEELRHLHLDSMTQAFSETRPTKRALRTVEGFKALMEMDRRGIELSAEEMGKLGKFMATTLPAYIDGLIVEDLDRGDAELADATWEAARDLPDLLKKLEGGEAEDS